MAAAIGYPFQKYEPEGRMVENVFGNLKLSEAIMLSDLPEAFSLICDLLFIRCLLEMACSDIRNKQIPDRFLLVSFFLFFLTQLSTGSVDQQLIFMLFRQIFLSLIFMGSLVLIEALFHKELLGGGDVKLMMVMRIYLGNSGFLIALLIACLAELLELVLLNYIKKQTFQEFPFGPALVFGTIVMLCRQY